jgi:hypothetical protein
MSLESAPAPSALRGAGPVILHHDAAELEQVVAGLVAFQKRTRVALRLRQAPEPTGVIAGNPPMPPAPKRGPLCCMPSMIISSEVQVVYPLSRQRVLQTDRQQIQSTSIVELCDRPHRPRHHAQESGAPIVNSLGLPILIGPVAFRVKHSSAGARIIGVAATSPAKAGRT